MQQKLYRIEKGIKLLPVGKTVSNGKSSMAAATLAALEKGDSFLIKEALEAVKAEKRMRDMNARQREAGGRVYTSRKVKGGARFWRLK